MKGLAAVILAVVVNMVVMFVLLSIAWAVLGTNGTFKPGSWETTDTWTAVMVVVRMVAAVIAAKFAWGFTGKQKTAYWAAAVILALGLAESIASMGTTALADPRPETVPMFDAMNNAHSPTWATFAWSALAGIAALVTAYRAKDRAT